MLPRSSSWRSAPVLFSTYWVSFVLTQVFLLGIAAASLIFLSAYGGMVSLAQVSIYGIAGFVVGNVVTTGESKGLNLGWNPWLGVLARRSRSRRRSRSSSVRWRAAAPGSTS